jgi:hypothetical protein
MSRWGKHHGFELLQFSSYGNKMRLDSFHVVI